MEVHESDLQKVRDVVQAACEYHANRDRMNAAVHMAATPRYSPLTTELASARDRLGDLIVGAVPGGGEARGR